MKTEQKFIFQCTKKKKKKNLRIYSNRISSLRIVQGPRYPFNRDRSATRAVANSIGSTKCWSPATPKRARFIASPRRLELINIPRKLSIPQNRVASFNRIKRKVFWIQTREDVQRRIFHKRHVRATRINSRISLEQLEWEAVCPLISLG